MMDALLSTVVRMATLSVLGFEDPALKNSDIKGTSGALDRDEITTESLHAYAKIEQELAIARRTLISETVEIEEYYGNSLKGGLGAKVSAADFGMDASAEKGKVTKRVIKFAGFNAQTESMLNAIEASLLSKLKAELSAKQMDKVSPISNTDTE
ncbi:hypothetical protein ACS25O_002429 [Enterobacter ludwigii]